MTSENNNLPCLFMLIRLFMFVIATQFQWILGGIQTPQKSIKTDKARQTIQTKTFLKPTKKQTEGSSKVQCSNKLTIGLLILLIYLLARKCSQTSDLHSNMLFSSELQPFLQSFSLAIS